MQVGKLKEENNQMLESYEAYGFINKTKMVDCALDLLRDRVKKERRRTEREQMLNQYAESAPANYFAEIDGDEFE